MDLLDRLVGFEQGQAGGVARHGTVDVAQYVQVLERADISKGILLVGR